MSDTMTSGGRVAVSAPGLPDRLLGTTRATSIWVIWHVLSAIAIPLAVAEFRLQIPLGEMSFQVRAFLAGLAVSHLFAILVLTAVALRRWRVGLGMVGLSVLLAYGVLFLLLQFWAVPYSRSVLIMATAGSFILTALSLDVLRHWYLVPALFIASAGMVQVAFAGWPTDDGVRWTTFYRVKLVETSAKIPSETRGGALELLGGGVLAASGDGGLYYIDHVTRDSVARRLPYDIPLDRQGFQADKPDAPYGNDPFRVTDILVQDSGERFRLFASHNYWNGADRCIGVRVSKTEALRSDFLQGAAKVSWQTVFDSQPCLPLDEIRFIQSGGAMVALDDQTLLLTIGDYNLDGFSAGTNAPQDPASHYGKTVRIDLASGTSVVHSIGHRNPQGVLRTADGRVWLTEQGPAGGDELNLVVQGANYGWPMVTYGAAYDKLTWPLSPADGRHAGYVEPVFAWVPSIAAASILSVQRDLFPLWKGDLLVASLKGHVIRLRVDDRRVVFAEPVYETKTRIRSMIEGPDGRLFLLQDGGAISFIEPLPEAVDPKIEALRVQAQPDGGERLFRVCQDCHRIGSGADHGLGPDLRGILGRDIASAPRFDYSAGLKALSGSWTAERLNRFLESPEEYAPGTTMQTEGVASPATRQTLIEHLAKQK